MSINIISIDTTYWVNGRTRLNQGNMNKIEGNLSAIVSKVNELVAYANANPHVTLAPVATSGSYNDLIDRPSIPAAQIQSDWSQSDSAKKDFIKNKPSLSAVATSGSYTDLTDKPSIPADTSDLTNGAGFITSSALSGYATEGYVREYVEANPASTTGTLTAIKIGGVSYSVPQGGGGGGMTNPMSALGDMIIGGANGAPARLAKGTDGQVLTLSSGEPSWQTPASPGMPNPMTSAGDMIIGGSSGSPARLAIGANGQVLTSNGSAVFWQTPAAPGMQNPMTSAGDLIVGGTAGAPSRLGLGASGQVLASDGSSLAWATALGWSSIYSGSNITSYSWDLLSSYKIIIMYGYRYGGPDGLNVCQVVLSPSVFGASGQTRVTLPLAMSQAATDPGFYVSGVMFTRNGNTLSWITGEYSGQRDFGVFRIEGLK